MQLRPYSRKQFETSVSSRPFCMKTIADDPNKPSGRLLNSCQDQHISEQGRRFQIGHGYHHLRCRSRRACISLRQTLTCGLVIESITYMLWSPKERIFSSFCNRSSQSLFCPLNSHSFTQFSAFVPFVAFFLLNTQSNPPST